ncbi:MAG: ABC transporter ATP-binding protein [Candidatus Aminicenantes bacterium]|nr:ABC transporter ATP-binding protein [Candidatus Aminicenantes bacterium]
MAISELEIKNLLHFYNQKKVLDIPHFQINPGECLAILGPNGAGKSTLLRIASLLEKPVQGEIFFRGIKADSGNELSLRRRLVYLLDRPLFFQGKVRDNLLYGLKIRGIKEKEQQKRLEEISELFHLRALLEKSPQELSNGEKQRVNLARALIIFPDLLCLDEPFSSLDQTLKEEIMREFQLIRKKRKQTTIIVTHNRDEAIYLADRLAILISGQIKQIGTTGEVLSTPASLEIATLLGHETLVEGIVDGQEKGLLRIRAERYQIYAFGSAQNGEKVKIIFRPEEVILAPAKPQSSIRNWFHGPIIEIKPLDKVMLTVLDCGFHLKAYLTRSAVEELGVSPGKEFWAGLKATSLSVKTLGAEKEN